jgi:hypothetical protein
MALPMYNTPRKNSVWVVATSWELVNPPVYVTQKIHVPKTFSRRSLMDIIKRRPAKPLTYDAVPGVTIPYPVKVKGDLRDALLLLESNKQAVTNYRIGDFVFYGLRPTVCIEEAKLYECSYDYFIDTSVAATAT